jgi:hypothetical protein
LRLSASCSPVDYIKLSATAAQPRTLRAAHSVGAEARYPEL